MSKSKFTMEQAKDIAAKLGIDFAKVAYPVEDFLSGLNVELEHGIVDGHTNVTNDDPLTTGKIALAHLNENALYYDKNIGLDAWEHLLDYFKGDTKGKKVVIVDA